MTRTRYRVVKPDSPHFLTATVVNWLPLFASRSIVQILLDSLTYLQENERMTVYAYGILENHLHLVAEANDLSKEMGNFKSFTARRIIDTLKQRNAGHILQQLSFHKLRHKEDSDYQVWQEGSHPQLIQGTEMMRQKVEYIHNNPIKRGYVDRPEHWRYSSARNYLGQPGLLTVRTEW